MDLKREARINLRDGTPMFTRSLVGGVGMAEDFKAGTSFGMHRSGLVAEGIVQAYQAGVQKVEDQVDIIEQVFETTNISFEKPYLNPRSNDIFEQPIFDKESRW
jgi:hypothetical protein